MKIKLSITVAALICAIALSSCSEKNSITVSDDTYESFSAVLEESEDMGDSYIDSFVFFGESTTYHMKNRGVLSGGQNTTQILADRTGTAILDETTMSMAVIYPETGELVPLCEAIKRKSPDYLLMTFGLNGAVQKIKQGEDYYKDCYLKLINAVKESSPKTKIILQSCFPVAENMDMSGYSVDLKTLNSYIKQLNKWSLELAEDEGLGYLNTNEILTDENGNLKLEYQSGDGHHLTRGAYLKIIKYIRTHGYK